LAVHLPSSHQSPDESTRGISSTTALPYSIPGFLNQSDLSNDIYRYRTFNVYQGEKPRDLMSIESTVSLLATEDIHALSVQSELVMQACDLFFFRD
jgi:hypothetical protein